MFGSANADGNRMTRALQRALEIHMGQTGCPVLEMLAFGLTRFRACDQRLAAAVNRHELNPSFPHSIIGKAPDGACVKGA